MPDHMTVSVPLLWEWMRCRERGTEKKSQVCPKLLNVVGANLKKGQNFLISVAKGSPRTVGDWANPVAPSYIIEFQSREVSPSLCIDVLAFYNSALSDSRVMIFDNHMWSKHVTELVFRFIATNTWR